MLVNRPDHPLVQLIDASGEMRTLAAADAFTRVMVGRNLRFEARRNLLYRIKIGAELPAPKWEPCWATTQRACVPVSAEWMNATRPHAAVTRSLAD